MKRLVFILVALFSISIISYASFPVSETLTDKETVVVVDDSEMGANSSSSAADPDWTLFVVCLFVGYLGVHRFMMGDVTVGILQLLTLGGCGIWTLIDLIRIATGDLRRPGY